MYRKILVALDNSAADEPLLKHIAELAGLLHSQLLLMHVSHGATARYQEQLDLAESEEMKAARAHLESTAEQLRRQGLEVSVRLGQGDPCPELLKAVASEGCDLIAMGGHGHGLLADLFLGSIVDDVRHRATVPVLIVGPKTVPT